MEAKLIKIGNSKGVRLPKSMLVQTGMTESIEIEMRGNLIILKPKNEPRSDWEASFAKANQVLSDEDRDWLDADLVTDSNSDDGVNW